MRLGVATRSHLVFGAIVVVVLGGVVLHHCEARIGHNEQML